MVIESWAWAWAGRKMMMSRPLPIGRAYVSGAGCVWTDLQLNKKEQVPFRGVWVIAPFQDQGRGCILNKVHEVGRRVTYRLTRPLFPSQMKPCCEKNNDPSHHSQVQEWNARMGARSVRNGCVANACAAQGSPAETSPRYKRCSSRWRPGNGMM